MCSTQTLSSVLREQSQAPLCYAILLSIALGEEEEEELTYRKEGGRERERELERERERERARLEGSERRRNATFKVRVLSELKMTEESSILQGHGHILAKKSKN